MIPTPKMYGMLIHNIVEEESVSGGGFSGGVVPAGFWPADASPPPRSDGGGFLGAESSPPNRNFLGGGVYPVVA